MENKRKKGFTLIELLAIIVILAIIAVITVPIILNIVDDSKKGAAQNSAYGYKDAVNKYYLAKSLNNSDYDIADGQYSIDPQTGYLVGTETLQIQISGQAPTGGTVQITQNEIASACLEFGEYAVTILNGNVGQATKESCNALNNGAQLIMSKAITETDLAGYADKSTVKVPVIINHPAITENTATGSTIPALTSYTYMGANPDNYIYFNCDTYVEEDQNSQTCEMWRIISVENGKIKITTADTIGSMPWDDGSNHGGTPVNDWATSGLYDFLNGSYLNGGIAINYTKDGKEISIPARIYFDGYTLSATGSGSGSGSGSGTSLGKRYSYLNSTTASLISTTTWYLGGGAYDSTALSALAYAMERGNEKYTRDGITRTTSVNSKVGIMSPSDYGFASGACYSNVTLDYDGDGINGYNASSCTSSNWLYNGYNQWLISTHPSSMDAAWFATDYGDVDTGGYINDTYGVRPVVYLDPNIILSESGSGTSSDPYKIIQ